MTTSRPSGAARIRLCASRVSQYVRGGVDDRLQGGLPLPHRLVGLPALGHVHDVAEGVDQHALVVVDEPGHAQQPAVAVPEQEAVLLLQLRGPLGDGPLERPGEAVAVLGVELVEPEAGRAQHLLRGVAEDALHVAADEALAAAAQQPPEHHHGAPGDDVLQHGLGLAQGLLALAEQHRRPFQAVGQGAQGVPARAGRQQGQPAGQPFGVALQLGRPAGHARGEQQHGRDPAGHSQQHAQRDRAQGQGPGPPGGDGLDLGHAVDLARVVADQLPEVGDGPGQLLAGRLVGGEVAPLTGQDVAGHPGLDQDADLGDLAFDLDGVEHRPLGPPVLGQGDPEQRRGQQQGEQRDGHHDQALGAQGQVGPCATEHTGPGPRQIGHVREVGR
ncbi:MAG TPA: hypothetical protein VG673_00065, partial [Actinomycetota bacterium]|nr:hypothetical protein [Actinomycetota bacterium]